MSTGLRRIGSIQPGKFGHQGQVHISGIKLPVKRALYNADELGHSPWLKMYRTDAEALQALRQLEPLPQNMAAAAI